MMIVLGHYFDRSEIEQRVVSTPEEAMVFLAEANAVAAPRWRWALSETNFVKDDGSEMSIDEANVLRRACGVAEY